MRLRKPPAILQVIPHLETGGAELSTLEIVDALSAVGARALVATEGGRMASDVERLGGEIIPLPMASKNPLQMFRNKLALERLIVEHEITLVHARSRAPAWSSFLATSQVKVPFVTTYHGAYGEREPVKRIYNSVMARGDRVIANSHFTADFIRARYPASNERLRIIYRGVDIERFSRSAISRDRTDQLLEKWGVSAQSKIIFHPARLTRLKGQGVLIAAMKELIERNEDENSIIIFAGDHQGRVEYEAELRSKIKQNGLEKRVLLVGHCTDIAAAYAVSYVTIIASTEPETFGRTSVEAQSMGCPVIATTIGAPPETVRAAPSIPKNEVTGWLVPPNEPQALARALTQVLAMDEGE